MFKIKNISCHFPYLYSKGIWKHLCQNVPWMQTVSLLLLLSHIFEPSVSVICFRHVQYSRFPLSSWIHDYQDACVDKLEKFISGELSTQQQPSVARPSLSKGSSLNSMPEIHGGMYKMTTASVSPTTAGPGAIGGPDFPLLEKPTESTSLHG